jgi:DNA-binding PadR family transcriptional regulator
MPADRHDERPISLKAEDFHILLALEDGERHGYAILKEIERATAGALRLAPSPFYRKLKRMEARGWIVEAEERPAPELDDERRRYYALTPLGRGVVAAEARRLVALTGTHPVLRLAGVARPPGGN